MKRHGKVPHHEGIIEGGEDVRNSKDMLALARVRKPGFFLFRRRHSFFLVGLRK
jgi:hypothetical protein